MWLVGINTVTGDLPFRLVSGDFVVGRARSAQIVIAETTVSRKHASLTCDGNLLTVQDLGSSNGTFVNEVAVAQSPLRLGDHVRFGRVACAIAPTPLFSLAVTEDESTYQIPLPKSSGDSALTHSLTAAQLKIIPLLMKGRSEPEIATTLGKSPHTIHTHIRTIFEKAGVHSREELIVKLMNRDSSDFSED